LHSAATPLPAIAKLLLETDNKVVAALPMCSSCRQAQGAFIVFLAIMVNMK
jgi:hypothetical protein